jgi:hypothetical protein
LRAFAANKKTVAVEADLTQRACLCIRLGGFSIGEIVNIAEMSSTVAWSKSDHFQIKGKLREPREF